MSDYDKSMYLQFICNQRVVNCNKFLYVNSMGLSAPWYDFLDIISMHPVKKCKE